MTFAPRYLDYPDLLAPLYARIGSSDAAAASDDLEADVVTNNPTSGQTVEIDLDSTKKNRHAAVFEGIVLSATDSIVLEFRRKSDSVWEQGASAYQYKELITSSGTNPTLAANMPAGDFNAAKGPINGVFFISGSGLAVPSQVVSRDWDDGGEIHDCTMTDENLHDQVRFRITGAATFVSGTIYLIRME